MKLNIKEIAILSIFSALMYTSKLLMSALPNIHLIGVLIVSITIFFRAKALYSIYTYVFIEGLFAGFATWWIPYLYVWTVLWAIVMLLPKNIPAKFQPFVYMTVCGLHGLGFGAIYAPAQALLFGLNFKGMLTWIAAGFPFDVVHGIGNFVLGLLIVPIVSTLKKLIK